MIALSVSRTLLVNVPLSIVDTGESGYVLMPNGWAPGRIERDNEWAESADLDGGSLIRTRSRIVSMSLSCRVWGASPAVILTACDTLAAALGQFSYTITETMTGRSTAYDCGPAVCDWVQDPLLLAAGLTVFTASIPRQPL